MNNSESQRRMLLEGSIPALVTKMAIPSVIMQVITLVYNTVDTYYIAQINKSAAAAVGTVLAIQAVIQAIGYGFGMGVSSLCSRSLGEASDEEANVYAASGTVGAVATAACFSLLCLIFLDPLLRVIGCSDTMLPYAAPYARVVLLTSPIACCSFVLNNIMKAEGHLLFSMYGNVSGALVNVVLDPLLIFTLGWGTMGAALATAASQLISLTILSSQFLLHKTVMQLRLQNVSRKAGTYRLIVTTGLPTVFRQGLTSLATALLCNQASIYGDAAVAAVTISNKCYMLIRNIVLGIGQGSQPVAGYNFGAGQYARARDTYHFAMKVGTAICLAACALLYAFAGPIIWWFCQDEEVLLLGRDALRFAAIVVPFMAFSTYVNQEHQCLGFKAKATFLASCRQGICFVPSVVILPAFLGVTGVELAQPAADLLTFLISIPFFISLDRILSQPPKV